MIIDERKVNLAEKDIEQWLWENPQSVTGRFGAIKHWIKRQYKVPSGVVDLVGVAGNGQIAIIEVKNVAIDASALTQACRYAEDVDYIYQSVVADVTGEIEENIGFWDIEKMVIGRSFDTHTLLEAEALGVSLMSFEVSLSLSLSSQSWTDDFLDRRREERRKLSDDPDWNMVVQAYVDSWRRRYANDDQRPTPAPNTLRETSTEE